MWLDDDEFLTSIKGQAAVIAAAKALFRRGGADCRIVKSRGAGGGEHVTMTVRHYMLIGSFVRHELMIAAGLRSRPRHGKSEGAFKKWVFEINAVENWLRKDADVNNGMSLVDGAASRDFFYEIVATLPAANTPDIPATQTGASTSAGSGSSSGSRGTAAELKGALGAGTPGNDSTSNANHASKARLAPTPSSTNSSRRLDAPEDAELRAAGSHEGDGRVGDAFDDANLFPATAVDAGDQLGPTVPATDNDGQAPPGWSGGGHGDVGGEMRNGDVNDGKDGGDLEYAENDDNDDYGHVLDGSDRYA
eukprot:TRINITY_DN6511_c0_g1_i1.p1 TRINITY_DN6511_c0_g1~~TRINITY_DN6511_c0_g1_i1.p1  ORF type:complete len:306 (-),score=53.85 TRINITY_DN6511_c0_g1_i1:302-1219(-)